MSSQIIVGIKAKYVLTRIWLRIFILLISHYHNPVQILKIFQKFISLKSKLVSRNSILKIVKANNRYYWDFNQPGWPSEAFDQNIRWFGSFLSGTPKRSVESVRLVFLAITKKCPMNCEHCYEGDSLNKPETTTKEDLVQIVKKYQSLGAASFIIGGGEPMCRYDDLLTVIKSAGNTSEFWISTSGYGFTRERAKELKEAGLSGITLSVDHFDKEANNLFRGHPHAMQFAWEAAKNCNHAGLGLAMSLCVTRDFVKKENLLRYAEFSFTLGAGFIWLIEPRPEGRWKNKDVTLEPKHYAILDDFFLTVNSDKKYKQFPRILFPNYNHRFVGCAGGGISNILIDTDGFVNPCPFCRGKVVHALSKDAEEKVMEMKSAGCFKYKTRIA